MRFSKANIVLDSIVILIQVTFNLSIVSSLFNTVLPIPYGLNLLIFMIVCHVIRFGLSFRVGPFIKNNPILIVFFIIYFLDIFQNIFLIIGNAFVRFVLLVNAFFFLDYLYQVFVERSEEIKRISTLTKSFSIYSLYNIAVILIAAFLILFGLLNPLSNPVEMELMQNNIDEGQLYYFPGYLSIMTQDTRFFEDINLPMLCGLSHEPHVVALLVLPGVLFLIPEIKNSFVKSIVLISCLIAVFLGQSTTAILCFIMVLALHLFEVFIREKRKTEILFFAIVVIVVLIYLSTYMNTIFDLIMAKVGGEGGSKDYSAAMLSYILHPSFVFGYGNVPPALGEKVLTYDIGLCSSIFDVLFFVMLVILSFRAFRSKDEYIKYIGLGVLYFSIHGLKMAYQLFGYPYLVFILFCLSMAKSIQKKRVNS